MINVNQITAQLARMPDQALQQYAAMHKNDPYTVSLALSESNRRKQMREANQGMQGMQPQPKVVDQGISEMAAPMPEEVGIGALPAGEMNFADGGIVGYAGGGLNFNERAAQQMEEKGSIYDPFYGYPTAERQRMQMEAGQRSAADFAAQSAALTENNALTLRAAAQQKLAELQDNRDAMVRRFGAKQYDQAVARAQAEVAATEARGQARMNQQAQTGAARVAEASIPPAGIAAPFTRPGMGKADPRLAAGFTGAATGPGAGISAAIGAGRGAAPPSESGVPDLLPTRAPRAPGAGIAAVAPAGSGDFMSQYTAARKDRKVEDPEAAEEERIQKAEKAAADKRLADFDADVAARGDARAGQKSRLDKRESELGKEKNRNEGIAFLEAGLAMMQSKGRGLAGIAQGAGVGVKAYTSGIEKLKLAQEKLDEARDKIDEAQDTENQLTKKERRGLLADADKTVLQAQRNYLVAKRTLRIQDEDLTKTAVASDIATQRSREQQRSQERIAAAQASRSVISDANADRRARLTAAKDLAANANATLKSMEASDDDKAAARRDLVSANAVLRDLGGMLDVSAQAKADVAKYLNRGNPTK